MPLNCTFKSRNFILCVFTHNENNNMWNIVQLLNHVQLFVTPWTAACQASLSFTIFQSSLKFMFIVSVMLSNHLILCCPLLLPSVFPSIRVFSSELALYIRWPKCWSIFIIHCSVSLHVFTIVLFFYDAGVL